MNDTALIAGQLADLTRTVEGMANQLKAYDFVAGNYPPPPSMSLVT